MPRVQVVLAWPHRSECRELELGQGATVGDAIREAGLAGTGEVVGYAVFGVLAVSERALQCSDKLVLVVHLERVRGSDTHVRLEDQRIPELSHQRPSVIVGREPLDQFGSALLALQQAMRRLSGQERDFSSNISQHGQESAELDDVAEGLIVPDQNAIAGAELPAVQLAPLYVMNVSPTVPLKEPVATVR